MAASPYKGLAPYTEDDTELFFGRETERELIAANLLANRLTLLYGPSGVGKSSVLEAGAVHDIRVRARRSLERHGHADAIAVVVREWAGDPTSALLAQTRDALTVLPGAGPALEDPPGGLKATLESWSRALGIELLLILDQFEEYFTYGLHGPRGEFADELARIVSDQDLPVRVLISIREDALAKLDAFKGRIPGLFNAYLRIEHLDLDAARSAITRPVARFDELAGTDERHRHVIEPGLVDVVLDQVRSGGVSLAGSGAPVADAGERRHVETPFLQLVMDRLWQVETEQGSRVLRRSTLAGMGGAQQIVRTHVASVMSSLTADDQDLAASVFHYLVTPSGMKVAHSSADLSHYTGGTDERLASLLERLCSSRMRILRPQPVPGRPEEPPRWEIVHDVLAQAVLEWGRERAAELEAAQRELQARQDERARHQARIRRIRSIATAGLIVALAVTVFLESERRESARAEDRAEARTELVTEESSRSLTELSRLGAEVTVHLKRDHVRHGRWHATVVLRNVSGRVVDVADIRPRTAHRTSVAIDARDCEPDVSSGTRCDIEIAVRQRPRPQVFRLMIFARVEPPDGGERLRRELSFTVPARGSPLPRRSPGATNEGRSRERTRKGRKRPDVRRTTEPVPTIPTPTEPPRTNTQPPETNTQPPETNTQPPETNTQPPETNTQPPETNTQPPETNTPPPPRTTPPPCEEPAP